MLRREENFLKILYEVVRDIKTNRITVSFFLLGIFVGISSNVVIYSLFNLIPSTPVIHILALSVSVLSLILIIWFMTSIDREMSKKEKLFNNLITMGIIAIETMKETKGLKTEKEYIKMIDTIIEKTKKYYQ